MMEHPVAFLDPNLPRLTNPAYDSVLELIPNLEFWLSVPSLVAEGWAYLR